MIKDTKSSRKKTRIPTLDDIKFNLRHNPKDKRSALRRKATDIFAVFRYDGKRLVYATQQKIAPQNWLPKEYRPKSDYQYYDELQGELNKIKKAVLDTYKIVGDVQLAKFREFLDRELGRLDNDSSNVDYSFIDFIEDFSNRKLKLGELSANTVKKYRTVKKKLETYSKSTGNRIDFDDITLSFKDHYLNWMYEHTTSQSANTANKEFATIKILLKKAYKEKLHTNLIFEDEDFGVSRVKTSKISWSEEEVQQLFEYKVVGHKKLKAKNISVPFAKKVKDWFLVACYSSLRWSDFTNISKDNITSINEDLYIHTWTQKNNEEVYIPINKNLLAILEEYNYQSPSMSSQRFNEAIKVVAEMAGIKAKVILNTSVKGKPMPVSKRKCDIVSSHDGRRTWASINYSEGFSILLLMQVTGHRKESTFLSYIGMSKKEMAIKLMEQMKAQESKLMVV